MFIKRGKGIIQEIGHFIKKTKKKSSSSTELEDIDREDTLEEDDELVLKPDKKFK